MAAPACPPPTTTDAASSTVKSDHAMEPAGLAGHGHGAGPSEPNLPAEAALTRPGGAAVVAVPADNGDEAVENTPGAVLPLGGLPLAEETLAGRTEACGGDDGKDAYTAEDAEAGGHGAEDAREPPTEEGATDGGGNAAGSTGSRKSAQKVPVARPPPMRRPTTSASAGPFAVVDAPRTQAWVMCDAVWE